MGSLNLYRAPSKIKNDLKWPRKITFVCRSYWSHTVIVLTDAVSEVKQFQDCVDHIIFLLHSHSHMFTWFSETRKIQELSVNTGNTGTVSNQILNSAHLILVR